MRGIGRDKTSEWARICPVCNRNVYHKNANSLRSGMWKNCPCWTCRSRLNSEKTKGRPRPPFTDEWKRNIGTGHKKSKTWKASMNTPEYKEKHRQKMLQMIREGKSKVAFNRTACDVFDFLNEQLHWNGQHGTAGKEKSVDVFFLDYYEPTLNVAIEYDEKHHRKPSRYKGDWIKQKVVMDTIGCEFYRVDEVSQIVRKIDKLPTDRTQQLQEIITQYYETKNQRTKSYQHK